MRVISTGKFNIPKLFFLFFLISLLLFVLFQLLSQRSVISEYKLRDDYDSSFDEKKMELLEIPEGGCVKACIGIKQQLSCRKYSRKYDICEYYCYGGVKDNCSNLTF
ncbi:MAG: hypothetical protein ACD_24C00341G0004 [uncultured bacterium]|nr:MAG: hypothetical protein ACD_24C00341G0004 [uncultured bacterium]